MKQRFLLSCMPLVAVLAAGCTDATGRLTLALSSRTTPGPVTTGAPAVALAGDSTVIVAGNDTVVVRNVELVLREIELKRVETAQCDDIMDNDDCEEFETGPVLVSLPLGAAATATEVSIDAPAGMYDELEFEIHKPEDNRDAAFIAAHPAFAAISIRVTGTFSKAGTRTDFTYITDLNEKQEIALDPPLTVAAGAATNVTLRLDLSRWFLNGGALVDPATANQGGVNEGLVRDNIGASIDAFRDNDRDGRDDDHEEG